MVDVTTSTVIDRPVDVVADFACDARNVPHWYRNIRTVRVLDEGPLRVGARAAFEATFLGRTLSYVYEVVEFVPHEVLVMSTAQGPFPMRTSYRFTPVGDSSTRMELRNSGEPKGFPAWTARLVEPMMRRENTRDLQVLKELLKAR